MKSDRGLRSYHSGLSAEEAVERDYVKRGYSVAHRRYRKAEGEIDLILRNGADVVFVEVKQSKTHDQAALSLSQNQIRRIFDCASVFLSGEPGGQDTPSRFDLGLVDGQGRVQCVENFYAA